MFQEDALLNDQLRDFWGVDAIRSWLASEVLPERLSMEVLQLREHYRDHIVEAIVRGDFDTTGLPDPLVLAFHFGLHDGLIGRLLILHKRPIASEPDLRTPRAVR